MYLNTLATKPKRVPQRMIRESTATKLAHIANKRNLTQPAVETLLFNLWHGRKSLDIVQSIRAIAFS